MATATFLERFRPLRSALAMFFRMGAVGWIIMLVLVVMILGMIDNMLFNRGGAPTAAVATPGPMALPSPLPGGTVPPALPSPQSPGGSPPITPTPLPDPAIAAARAELSEASRLLKEASDSVAQAVAQVSSWDREIEPLRLNADGQAIAAHADLAQQMTFLVEQQRPTAADLQGMSNRIEILAEETDRLSASDPPTRLGSDKIKEVRELHRQAQEAESIWSTPIERGRAIAREARRRQPPAPAATAGPPSTATTTTQTVPPPSVPIPSASQSPTEIAAQVPTAAASATPEPPSSASDAPSVTAAEPTPKGNTLQGEIERIKDQQSLDAIQEQIALKAERKRNEDARIAEQHRLAELLAAQKAKLAAEARSEDVQRVLQPFLVHRNLQPRLAGASLRWRQTVDQQPMSFSALEGVGALADTVQGLAMLARVGSSREIASPRWEYNPSPRTWSTDTQDRLKQAQDLLRRLGPTLVEEGLLSP